MPTDVAKTSEYLVFQNRFLKKLDKTEHNSENVQQTEIYSRALPALKMTQCQYQCFPIHEELQLSVPKLQDVKKFVEATDIIVQNRKKTDRYLFMFILCVNS